VIELWRLTLLNGALGASDRRGQFRGRVSRVVVMSRGGVVPRVFASQERHASPVVPFAEVLSALPPRSGEC
jgi:hypothetical protein